MCNPNRINRPPLTPPHTQTRNTPQAKLIEEVRKAERVARLQDGINEFCVAGEWRRTPYAPRQYEAVRSYVPGRSVYYYII